MYGCRQTGLQLQCWHCKCTLTAIYLFPSNVWRLYGWHLILPVFIMPFQETNPIFLFNKEMILSDRDPTIPKTTFSIESEIQVKVEESLLMPAVFHTVASRTQLALVLFQLIYTFICFCFWILGKYLLILKQYAKFFQFHKKKSLQEKQLWDFS